MGFQDRLIPFWRFRGTMVVVGAGRGSLFRDCGWRGGALESRWPPWISAQYGNTRQIKSHYEGGRRHQLTFLVPREVEN